MKTILCIGDSITAGYPYGSSCFYGRRLAEEYDAVNRGVPGETTNDIRRRLLREIRSVKPDLVLIEAGTNDVIFSICAEEESFRNLREMIRTIRQEGAKPVVLTCLIPDEKGVPHWFAELAPVQRQLKAYNGMLRKHCQENGIPLIDTETLELEYSDGVHPTRDGYRIYAESILAQLKTITDM